MKKVYEEESIRAIAEKIREKTGEDNSYKVSEMPEGIEKVFIAGESQGSGGYDKGYEEGKKAEYDAFWDTYQQNGERTNYENAFSGIGWDDKIFKPKYDITAPGYATQMFWNCQITDLSAILKKQNVRLITEGCTNPLQMFYRSKITTIPPLDFTNATGSTSYAFGSNAIKTIECLKVSGNTVFHANMFNNATALENITFEGVIANNLDMHWSSKLTHDSLMSIIKALKDFNSYETLTYSYGNFGECVIEGFYTDPKGIEFYVTSAVLNGTTLVCQSKYNNYENEPCDVTITVTNIDISREDVAKIKSIKQNVIDYTPETGFITDVLIITKDKASEVKTLTLGTENLAKLSEEEKSMATDKGWELT